MNVYADPHRKRDERHAGIQGINKGDVGQGAERQDCHVSQSRDEVSDEKRYEMTKECLHHARPFIGPVVPQ